MLKIIADSAIPFLEGVLDSWAEVRRLPGAVITAADVRDADALIIRTRTRCNAALLDGSRVGFIATATIGFDHIDLEYCRRHGIGVATAAGCNARGVLQWAGAVLHYLSREQGWSPAERTLGVVGVGHVGSLVSEYAHLLTFHTPLDTSTRGMGSAALFARMKPGAVVMNSSRGEVVDGQALLESGHPFVLDVWEHEPDIAPALLDRALLATPHIAGYTEQGKANATAAAVAAVARAFRLPLVGWYPPSVTPSRPRPISWEELGRTIRDAFDIEAESRYLKGHRGEFEQLRDHYSYRREYF